MSLGSRDAGVGLLSGLLSGLLCAEGLGVTEHCLWERFGRPNTVVVFKKSSLREGRSG